MSQIAEHNLSQILSELMVEIYETVGVRVVFNDPEGNILASSGELCPLCENIKKNPDLFKRCAACRKEAISRAEKSGNIFFYRCWRGLMEAAIHVESQGTSLGNFIVTGFVSDPEKMQEVEQLMPEACMKVLESDRKEVPYVHYIRARDTIRTVGIAARYLAEVYNRQSAEIAQKDAEYRALQSQISPHFLFNTLNSISQVAVLEGCEKTPELIYSLSVLLRKTMKQNVGLVPLKEELETIREYIKIKQITGRFPIQYYEEVEKTAEEYLVPTLMLQPLVENAIRHGLEKNNRGGTVSVVALKNEDEFFVSVTDDGSGFEADKTRFSSQSGGELSGLGIANVFERMQRIYGARFREEIITAPGEGTTISMRIGE